MSTTANPAPWSEEDVAHFIYREKFALTDPVGVEQARERLRKKTDLMVIYYHFSAGKWQRRGVVAYCVYDDLIEQEADAMIRNGMFHQSRYACHLPGYNNLDEFDSFMLKQFQT